MLLATLALLVSVGLWRRPVWFLLTPKRSVTLLKGSSQA